MMATIMIKVRKEIDFITSQSFISKLINLSTQVIFYILFCVIPKKYNFLNFDSKKKKQCSFIRLLLLSTHFSYFIKLYGNFLSSNHVVPLS